MFRCYAVVATVLMVGSGCTRAGSAESIGATGVATLRDAAGRTVGTAEISAAAGGGARVRVTATGLTSGVHAMHVHEVGACDGSTPTPFSSAGGHLNPAGREHGRLNPAGPHAGDLPNLTIDASGNGTVDAVVPTFALGDDGATVFDANGSAIVIHANPDDERTNEGASGPGNSGARIACGVIARR
jgi:Cu-Zn family superoxide dismutase